MWGVRDRPALVARAFSWGRRDGSTAAPWLPCSPHPEAPSPGSLSEVCPGGAPCRPAGVWGVSRGMGGPAARKGRRSCQFQPVSRFLQKTLLYSSSGDSAHRPPLWVWGSSHSRSWIRRGITMQAPAAVSLTRHFLKVKHSATVCPNLFTLYPSSEHIRIHNSTIHNSKNTETDQMSSVDEQITKCILSTQWNCIWSQKWNEVLILNI